MNSQIQFTSLADSRLKLRTNRCNSLEQQLKPTFEELDIIKFQLSELKRRQKQQPLIQEEVDELMEVSWPYENKQYRGSNWHQLENSKDYKLRQSTQIIPQNILLSKSQHLKTKSYQNFNLGINRYGQHFASSNRQNNSKRNSNLILLAKGQQSTNQHKINSKFKPINFSQLIVKNSQQIQSKQLQAIQELEQMKSKTKQIYRDFSKNKKTEPDQIILNTQINKVFQLIEKSIQKSDGLKK